MDRRDASGIQDLYLVGARSGFRQGQAAYMALAVRTVKNARLCGLRECVTDGEVGTGRRAFAVALPSCRFVFVSGRSRAFSTSSTSVQLSARRDYSTKTGDSTRQDLDPSSAAQRGRQGHPTSPSQASCPVHLRAVGGGRTPSAGVDQPAEAPAWGNLLANCAYHQHEYLQT